MRRCKVIAVRHRGGVLQANTGRLMQYGDIACEDTSSYLINENNDDKLGNTHGIITKDKISRACKDCGNLFCLFNNVFYVLNKKGNF